MEELADDNSAPELTSKNIRLGIFSAHKVRAFQKRCFIHRPSAIRSTSSAWSMVWKNKHCYDPCRSTGTPSEMRGRALVLRRALADLCDMSQFNKRGDVWLRHFAIDDDEFFLPSCNPLDVYSLLRTTNLSAAFLIRYQGGLKELGSTCSPSDPIRRPTHHTTWRHPVQRLVTSCREDGVTSRFFRVE